jgi:hypothetical protein
MNQGVQGGSYIYQYVPLDRNSMVTWLMTRHTFHQFQKQGYEAQPVELQVSFGKGDKVSFDLRTFGGLLLIF